MESELADKSYVLILGNTDETVLATIGQAAEMAAQEVLAKPTLVEVGGWVEERESRPTAILLNMDEPGASERAIEVRSRFSLAAVPIIALGREVDNLSFAEAFSSGMDDACPIRDAQRLGRRLRHLAELEPVSVERRDRTIVIADSDRQTRLIIGRVFRDAGFQVSFAEDAADALRQSLDEKVAVVVVSEAIDREAEEPMSVRAPREGSAAAWIINTPPKEIPPTLRRLRDLGGKVAVHDAFAAPATLLFVANELLSTHGKEGRKSERLLYGAVVRFRPAGRSNDEIGYSFNISQGGMYARTLAMPERWDELWLEFVPPRSDRAVHLEGTVVWARRYGPGGTATVPTGFGVEITGGSQNDLDRYKRSYQAFLAERVALRESTRPPTSEMPPFL